MEKEYLVGSFLIESPWGWSIARWYPRSIASRRLICTYIGEVIDRYQDNGQPGLHRPFVLRTRPSNGDSSSGGSTWKRALNVERSFGGNEKMFRGFLCSFVLFVFATELLTLLRHASRLNCLANQLFLVRMRLPGKGEIILSVSAGEVAFYEAAFSAGLRCLYSLLKGPGLESGWLYFKEFHLSIPHEEGAVRVPRSWGAPGKQCNKVPVLSEIEDERFRRVFEKIGEGGHFKIPVVLDSRTFHKYFALGRVEMSSSGGAMSNRIKLSLLAKVVAEKTTTSSKGVVISEVSETPSRPLFPGEGNASKSIPGEALGPHAFVMASAATAEKILAGVILPVDKEKVEKTFDQVVTRFLHVLGQRGTLAEANAREAKAAKEVEARDKEVTRLQLRVAELEKTQNLTKGRIIAAFKESKNF
ncbi:aminopeptidase P1 [Actinidia rufa]|uniref:Aminopeptidase P1 n=1 Tax=Actinidia rufa TaxID=165716 RepID=A0A7J0DIL4_9ERIC|nr:aminopeptidase P1 [Actinidia rufa]